MTSAPSMANVVGGESTATRSFRERSIEYQPSNCGTFSDAALDSPGAPSMKLSIQIAPPTSDARTAGPVPQQRRHQ